MKELGVLSSESFFLSLAPLGKARQDISGSISLAMAIIDSEMVPEELFGPSDLPGAQALDIHELAEVVVLVRTRTSYLQPSKQCGQILKASTMASSSCIVSLRT